MTIHVVGNLCIDTTLGVERFPAPGETLVATSSRSGLGGKGLNQAVAAARTGAPVTLRAPVGIADRERLIVDLAGERGLILRLAATALPTDASVILVRPDGENVIVSTTAAARLFDPLAETDLRHAIAAGDTLLMQGNLPAETTRACLAEARRRGAVTVLNPSPLWSAGGPIWSDVDWLVLNEGELRAISGDAEVETGAVAVLVWGAGAVVVTRGARGVLCLAGPDRIEIEAPAAVARDTSGAGDVFCGVLVGLLASGHAKVEALARATAAASLSVTRPGALASCPSAEEMVALPSPVHHRRVR
ncbi:MAG TPA: ribokinase [Lichenihabitans sp.]|jgi:ribokinase|nr:ribokinase [Lichenihabitans sp.]